MTTAELDIFLEDDPNPVEWYEINHDGYLSAERGFLNFLKTFLVENPNPPKTVAEFVKLMACPPSGGWCWLRLDASSSDKFGNWNPGPYTMTPDGDWKTSTGYSYRVRLRAGKWEIDCNCFHDLDFRKNMKRIQEKGMKAAKSGIPAINGNPYRPVVDAIYKDCVNLLWMHSIEIYAFADEILKAARGEKPKSGKIKNVSKTDNQKENQKMTITLDGRKDEIMKFMEDMTKAGYDGSVKAVPENTKKPKAKATAKATRGRPRKSGGTTDKVMKMIGEKAGVKFSELTPGRRRSYWRAIKYLTGKTKTFRA